MTSAIVIEGLDEVPLMHEEILALVRAKCAEKINVDQAVHEYIARTDTDTILSMGGTLAMAEIAGVLTPELKARALACTVNVSRQEG